MTRIEAARAAGFPVLLADTSRGMVAAQAGERGTVAVLHAGVTVEGFGFAYIMSADGRQGAAQYADTVAGAIALVKR